jgi:putative RecB family exonuclease
MTAATAVAGTAAPPTRGVDYVRAPNRVAEQITGRRYLSYTQINLMRSCPLKFKFGYIQKAPPDFIPSSLIFGGAIHRALELYFRSRLEGINATATGLMAAFLNSWKTQKESAGTNVSVRFNKGEDEDSINALGKRMIDAFLAGPLATPKGSIFGIEEELTVELDPDLPDILAKVDLVTDTGGALHVIDFKTSKSRWTEQKAQENAEQLLIYGTTMRSMSQGLGRPTKLHFAIITKAKSPAVQLLPVPMDKDRVVALTESIRQIWQAIQAGNFYPSPSAMNCSGCQFRSRCPVFGAAK